MESILTESTEFKCVVNLGTEVLGEDGFPKSLESLAFPALKVWEESSLEESSQAFSEDRDPL